MCFVKTQTAIVAIAERTWLTFLTTLLLDEPRSPSSIWFFFFFLLRVSITALATQMEVKRPLKQLSITPQVPLEDWRLLSLCSLRGLRFFSLSSFFSFFFYSIHPSSHTRCMDYVYMAACCLQRCSQILGSFRVCRRQTVACLWRCTGANFTQRLSSSLLLFSATAVSAPSKALFSHLNHIHWQPSRQTFSEKNVISTFYW